MWRRKRRQLKRRRSFCWIVSQVAIRPSSAKRCFNFFHQRIPSWPHDVSNSTGCKALQRKRKWSFPTKDKTCSTLDGKECVSAIEHLLKRLQAFSFAQKYKFPWTRAQHIASQKLGKRREAPPGHRYRKPSSTSYICFSFGCITARFCFKQAERVWSRREEGPWTSMYKNTLAQLKLCNAVLASSIHRLIRVTRSRPSVRASLNCTLHLALNTYIYEKLLEPNYFLL